MSFLDNIKLNLHKRNLKNEMKKNANIIRKSTPFEEAQKVGILFNATDKKQEELVMQYVERLRNKDKKRVSFLGFINKKKDKNDTNVVLFKNYNLSDLNWKGVPENEDVKRFIEQSFDIVINFFETPYLHGDYIMALSKASFRVGRNSNNTEAYELMINEKKKDDAHFVGLLDTYLKTFNNKPNESQTV